VRTHRESSAKSKADPLHGEILARQSWWQVPFLRDGNDPTISRWRLVQTTERIANPGLLFFRFPHPSRISSSFEEERTDRLAPFLFSRMRDRGLGLAQGSRIKAVRTSFSDRWDMGRFSRSPPWMLESRCRTSYHTVVHVDTKVTRTRNPPDCN